jgi:hypothetical protein
VKIEQFLTDHHIPYVTDHKNVRGGWVGLDCPFCGTKDKYHLGYSLEENYFSCWQCGGHSAKSVIAKLLGVTFNKAEDIIRKYGGRTHTDTEHRVKVHTKRLELPPGDLSLRNNHKQYLHKRNFDWKYLEQEWGIMGTDPIARVDHINYGNRILAPIYWNKRLVSFQTRDITGSHSAKYMACPPEREIISHKHILYGKQESWGDVGLCVEGIFDVWRLGTNAFAVLGIKFTTEQIRAIIRVFKEVIILFDPEEIAQWRARTLIAELEFKGVKARKVELNCDPADLDQDEADYLVKHLTNSKP